MSSNTRMAENKSSKLHRVVVYYHLRRFLESTEGFHLNLQQNRQVVECYGHVRVVWAKSLLLDGEGAFPQRFGFRILALEVDERAQRYVVRALAILRNIDNLAGC